MIERLTIQSITLKRSLILNIKLLHVHHVHQQQHTYKHKHTDPKDKYGWSRCLASLFVAKEFEHLQFAKDHSITIQDFDTWTVSVKEKEQTGCMC